MKLSTFFVAAALVAGSFTLQAAPHRLKAAKSPAKSYRMPALPFKVVAPGDLTIIDEAPEGTETLYSRDCDGFTYESFEATHSNIIGSLTKTVTTPGGEVYFSWIASEFPVGSWVKASRENDIITINCPQAIYSEYDWDYEEEVTVYVVPMRMVVDDEGQGTFVVTDDMTTGIRLTPTAPYQVPTLKYSWAFAPMCRSITRKQSKTSGSITGRASATATSHSPRSLPNLSPLPPTSRPRSGYGKMNTTTDSSM